MEIPVILSIVLGLLFVACILLLVHHGYSHRAGTAHALPAWEQFFQPSDVCNFHSCSHEMWILGVFGVGAILGICALIMHFAH
jgi:hypothetical protein